MTADIDWTGLSGKTYGYWFTPSIAAADLKDEGGNYMFVRQLPNGNWLPVYIGVADSLRSRLPTHEQLAEAQRLGATHVMTHTNPAGSQARLDEERDLIQKWNPALNIQHRRAV